MKKLGIIGGIGWPSTVEYYRLICGASLLYHANRKFSGPPPMPEMVIESLNMNYSVINRGTSDGASWMIWDAYFNQAMQRLVRAGAELIIIASVTPHSRLKEISENISVPILSIYDAIGEYCIGAGIRKLLVLGTMPTMSSPAFTENLHRFNVNAVYPTDDALKSEVVETINQLYQNKAGGTDKKIERVAMASIAEEETEKGAVCLACTELPLAFPEFADKPGFTVNGMMYLNTTVIHATYAFQKCI